MRFLTAVALALVMLWVPVDGVAQEPNPLTGLTTVDVRVFIDWDDDIQHSEEQYTQQVESAFELGILRSGLKNESEAPNFLNCTINLLAANDAGTRISYARTVSFEEMVVPWRKLENGRVASFEDVLWADTWSSATVGTVGSDNLNGAGHGQSCAEDFELAWRRANN